MPYKKKDKEKIETDKVVPDKASQLISKSEQENITLDHAKHTKNMFTT